MDIPPRNATAAAAPAPGMPPQRRGQRALRAGVLGLLAVTALLLIGAALFLAWGLRSERGSAWLLKQVPGLEIVNPRGTLLGDFGADSLVLRFGRGGEVRLDQVAWQGLRVSRFAPGPRWAHVDIRSLSAASGRLTLPAPDPNAPPTQPPEHLRLPLTLDLGQLSVGRLDAVALGAEPLRDIRVTGLRLGAAEHQLARLSLARGPLQLQAGARIGAAAPMPIDARLQVQQSASPQWPALDAQARLQGALARPALNLQLQAASQPPQAVTADAVLTPFAPFPLAQLQARVQALDLSALVSTAPKTALAGQASVQPLAGGGTQRLQVEADFVNAAAGPWNEGRVPLRRLQLAAAVDPRALLQLDVQSLQALLGSEARPAGRIEAQGRSSSDGWTLQARLDGVQPARLDARAPVMTVGGSVEASGRGFALAAAPAAAVAASAARAASAPAVSATPARSIEARAQLQGSVAVGRATRPLSAQLDGGWSNEGGGDSVALRKLELRAGEARVSASGTLARNSPQAAWRADARASADAFDLQAWLPGAAGGAPSRLAGDAEAALTLPSAGPGSDVLAWLATLQGRARVALRPSTLAGVPLEGSAQLASGSGGLGVTLRALAAGNSVDAEGRIARTPSADRWQARIDAAQLQRLSPLFALFSPPPKATRGAPRASVPPVSGRITGELVADGRWPAIRTRGQANATALQLPQLRLERADARWNLGTVGNAPLDLTLDASELRLNGPEQVQRVRSLALRVDGTAQAHRIDLRADVAARPPEWTDALQPPPPGAEGARTLGRVQAEGSLQQRGGGVLTQAMTGWQGRLRSVDLRRGGAEQPLLRASDVVIALRLPDAGRPLRVDVQPGRAELVGAGVRWGPLAYQAAQGNAPAAIDAELTLDPLPVAPLLARLQPGQAWQGDLEIEGHAVLHTAPALRADVLLQRRRGDISLIAGGTRRPLGLQRLRLALQANNGVWTANADVDGRQLGTLQAAASARTPAGQTWPDAATPVAGTAQLRLADLAVWDPWLPVGWRVDGRMSADLRFDGTLAAPKLAGTLAGDALAVSNFVEGVRLQDGELRAALQGDTLRIERFVARGGDGSVRIEGSAQLGAQPAANVVVVAERFRALARVDRRLDLSGRAELQLRDKALALKGRFEVDEGLVDLGASSAPALSSDVIVVDDPAPRQAGAGLPALEMDLRISLGSKLRVRGKGINTLLAGDLRISAPNNTLAIDGTVRTVGGVYAAYGETLSIERGEITFAGAVANPRLDIEAMRTDLDDIRVGVTITGTVQTPRIRLASTPEMSDLDKLSWLTLGRPSADLASSQTAVLKRAATALLAGNRGDGGPTLAQRVGLDTLSVEGVSTEGLGNAVVNVGKQLSERVYVGYRQSLAAGGGSWELIYKISQRFTVRMLTGEDPGVDAVWNWRWD